jgi:hypothetical protein
MLRNNAKGIFVQNLFHSEAVALKAITIALCAVSGLILTASVCFAQQGNEPSVLRTFTQEEVRTSGLRKLTPAELQALDAAISLRMKPVARREAGGVAAAGGMEALLNGYIIGDDGEYLGLITTDKFNRKSLLNDVGPHGSVVSPKSIFNTVGMYGSEVSPKSAFNDIAQSPPKVFATDGEFVGFLTTNDLKSPRIDPRAMIGWLRSK